MFQLDLKSRKSIYEQVIDNIKERIVTGILQPEDKLPSVRELSKLLTVNPNTVQKSYRELERQGYLYTVSGLGCFVSPPDTRTTSRQQVLEVRSRLRDDLKELSYLGLEKEEIQNIIEELLGERGVEL